LAQPTKNSLHPKENVNKSNLQKKNANKYLQIFANKDKESAASCWPMHSNPEIRPNFESNSDSDLNVCHASM
jgi:hypothetical protein